MSQEEPYGDRTGITSFDIGWVKLFVLRHHLFRG